MQIFLLRFNQICCILFSNVRVICLIVVEDQIRFNWRFKFKFVIQQIIILVDGYETNQIQQYQLIFWTKLNQMSKKKAQNQIVI